MSVGVVACGRGFGKVILLGEHAVVYGYRALAAALPSGVELEAEPGGVAVAIPQWDLDVAASAAPEHPVVRAVAAIAAELAKRDAAGRAAAEIAAVRLRGRAEIWPSAGLGSSAAFEVAAARAMAAAAGISVDDAAVRAAADAGECVFHGRPSGLDVALATAGGAGVFDRAHGLAPLPLPPLSLVIAHSGAPRSTAAMVARVAERTGGDAQDARLRGLGAVTERGIAAAARGELAALGAAMDEAHALLGELGVSTETLDELCAAARAAGAVGAKLSGAGGGGVVIALAPGAASSSVEAAWQRLGKRTLRVALGEPPLAQREHAALGELGEQRGGADDLGGREHADGAAAALGQRER